MIKKGLKMNEYSDSGLNYCKNARKSELLSEYKIKIAVFLLNTPNLHKYSKAT